MLHRDITRVLAQTDAREKFLRVGIETVGSTPEQFAAAIKSDSSRLSGVRRNAGIRAE